MQDEVLKHTMKVYRETKNKNHSFWEKAREIIIEILIIVFAVSISIWLHDWDEHKTHQKEVKEFLSDIKEDLNSDIKSFTTSYDSLVHSNDMYNYYLTADLKKLQDSSSSFIFGIAISTMTINDGDYEGFKSSGKIGYIENKKLKKLILSYYQSTAPDALEIQKMYNNQMQKIIEFVINHYDEKQKLFSNVQLRQMLKLYVDLAGGGTQQFASAIQQAKDIIAEIDKESK